MKSFYLRLVLVLLGWVASGVACLAQLETGPFGAAQPVVQVTSYWSDSGVKPGGQITLALVLDIRKPYHINSNKAKEGFISTAVELSKAPPEVLSSTPV